MPRFLIPASVLVVLAAGAAGAAARSTTVPVVHRGQSVRIAVAPGGAKTCTASVRYADGATQDTGVKHTVAGNVSWMVRVPNTAAFGLARWVARCGSSWQRSGSWRVANVTPSVPAVPVVQVAGNGFSQRPDQFGGGSKVSFGLMLKNMSGTRDAENVYVLVNFVDANGALLGSMSKTMQLIAAGTTYAYGDQMSLRTQVAVTKLEVTIRVGDGAPAVPHPLPHFTNIVIVPDSHDPNWVSEVDGEIDNDSSPNTMTYANLSIVVLDASGAIVGGGQTGTRAALPSGSRMVFLAQGGFNAIPTNKAATVVISALPQYQTG